MRRSYEWMEEARAEDLRRAGWSCSQVGAAMGIPRSTIAKWCGGLPVPAGTTLAIVRRCQRIIDLHLAGRAGIQIAEDVGVDQSYVSWVLIGARRRWPEIPRRDPTGALDGPLPDHPIVVRALDVISWRRSRR